MFRLQAQASATEVVTSTGKFGHRKVGIFFKDVMFNQLRVTRKKFVSANNCQQCYV